MFVVFLVVLAIAVYFYFPNKGKRAEMMVQNKLNNLPDEYFSIYTALFENNGRSTQIDHIVVSPYGVFVIETKGYKGWIYGGENVEYWTQNIYGKKTRFYNPIIQNEGHVRFLSYLLRDFENIPIIPIVVFNNEATIKTEFENHIVVNRKRLKRAIRRYRNEVLSAEVQKKIIDVIESNSRTGSSAERYHIRNVRNRERQSVRDVRNGKCPRCGSDLVLRRGKYGDFYGCSNYPNCRFLINKRDV